MITTIEARVTVTGEWAIFPFTYEGISFNSKVRANSRQLGSILQLPAGVFSGMNAAALRELGTIKASLTREDIQEELARLNAGSSWAILELAGE
jgi:hypothetical protein